MELEEVVRIGRDRAGGCFICVELEELVRIGRDRAGGCLICVELEEFLRIGRDRAGQMPHFGGAAGICEDKEIQSRRVPLFPWTWRNL